MFKKFEYSKLQKAKKLLGLGPDYEVDPKPGQNFSIQKASKTYKNDMNLLIFLDLTYNPGKNLKFYSLQGQNFKMFLIFTYNQGKVFLILSITRGEHMYTWSPLGVAQTESQQSVNLNFDRPLEPSLKG